jgi:hypothetical protein
MIVNDQDLELMEQWLDGELTEPQAEALRQRIAGEPQLAQVLDRLRGDRKMRAEIFAVLEPTHHDVDAMINNVRRAVRKEEVWAWRVRMLRQVSGVAAAIAMVFTAGWISRSKLHVGPITEPIKLSSPAILVYVPTPSATPVQPAAPDNTGTAAFTAFPRGRDGFSTMRPTYKIVLADPMNRAIAAKDLEDIGSVEDVQRVWTEFVSFVNHRQPPSATQPIRPQPNLVNQPGQ